MTVWAGELTSPKVPAGGGVSVNVDFPCNGLTGAFPRAGRIRRLAVSRTTGDAPTVAGAVYATTSASADDRRAAWVTSWAPVPPNPKVEPDFVSENGGPGWAYCLRDANDSLRVVLDVAAGGLADTWYRVAVVIDADTGTYHHA